jgi:hypothetical protein
MIRVDSVQAKSVVSLERLLAMPIAVPEIQRSVDEDVVASIVAFQRERFATHGSLLFLGDLVLAESGRCFSLVDGQHRYAALKQVYLLQPDYTVSLLIVHLDHTLTLENLFVLLNKSQPVPSYVIENTLDLNKRGVIESFDKLFRAEFKAYVSKSTSPRKPNVCLSSILDAIQQPTCPALRTLVTAHKLFEYTKWINLTHCKSLAMKCPRTLQACVAKAHPDESKALFLCTDRDHEWLHSVDLMTAFLTHKQDVTHASTPTSAPQRHGRVPIPFDPWDLAYVKEEVLMVRTAYDEDGARSVNSDLFETVVRSKISALEETLNHHIVWNVGRTQAMYKFGHGTWKQILDCKIVQIRGFAILPLPSLHHCFPRIWNLGVLPWSAWSRDGQASALRGLACKHVCTRICLLTRQTCHLSKRTTGTWKGVAGTISVVYSIRLVLETQQKVRICVTFVICSFLKNFLPNSKNRIFVSPPAFAVDRAVIVRLEVQSSELRSESNLGSGIRVCLVGCHVTDRLCVR